MKKFMTLLLCSIVLLVSFPMTAKADFGPKPSVQIDFEGLGDELCYGTLLSDRKSTGPSTAWDGTESEARHNENEHYSYATLDYETWKKFVDYKDSDGFYFLQESWRCNETKELNWTYYPPSKFKILLYFPENDTFFVSGIYERYAFDSHFTVDMNDLDVAEVTSEPVLVAKESYNYLEEILSFVARVIATILIEIAIAYAFLYYRKKQIRFIIVVNVLTQILLNVALSIIDYRSGFLAFTFAYVGLELIVFAVEAVLYKMFLPRWNEKQRAAWLPIAYALVANAVSFLVGLQVAKLIPEFV